MVARHSYQGNTDIKTYFFHVNMMPLRKPEINKLKIFTTASACLLLARVPKRGKEGN